MLKLSKTLFWDVDYDKLDVDKQSGFVIERVLENGNYKDWEAIKKYFGIDIIKQTVLNARYLNKQTLRFCSVIFNIPLNKFRCYNQVYLNQGLWHI